MGTSRKIFTELRSVGDHPHAYGDKSRLALHTYFSQGSSPRVWGQEITYGQSSSNIRIIPTRMGTSSSRNNPTSVLPDHPHAYGDKKPPSPSETLLLGSSPRVWGQGILIVGSYAPTGIIPTRMGTSSNYFLHLHNIEDHPHAYGDKKIAEC